MLLPVHLLTGCVSFFITAAAWAASTAESPLTLPDGRAANVKKPVQVFILLGQSNMVCMGRATETRWLGSFMARPLCSPYRRAVRLSITRNNR